MKLTKELVRCKQCARKVLYWPGMGDEIEEIVSKCSTGNEHANHQRKEPLQHHDIPSHPWVKVGSDLFELKGKQFCLVVDYFSKVPKIVHLGSSITSRSVIKVLKSVFSKHRNPGEGGGGG